MLTPLPSANSRLPGKDSTALRKIFSPEGGHLSLARPSRLKTRLSPPSDHTGCSVLPSSKARDLQEALPRQLRGPSLLRNILTLQSSEHEATGPRLFSLNVLAIVPTVRLVSDRTALCGESRPLYQAPTCHSHLSVASWRSTSFPSLCPPISFSTEVTFNIMDSILKCLASFYQTARF